MQTIEDFKNAWISRGITDVRAYQAMGAELRKDYDFCSKFEKINYKNFWKASHEFFGTDPIANNDCKLKTDLDITKIEDANKSNWSIAHYSGVTGLMDLFFVNAKSRNMKVNIAEIGSGYGSIFEFLKTKDPTAYKYTGFDLISRFEDSVEVDGEDGTLSEDQIKLYKNKFNLIYSFNVFQHLEKYQIAKYIDQSYTLLDKRNSSSMILGICFGGKTFHYGQIIDSPSIDEFYDMIGGKFTPVSVYKSFASNQHGLHLFYLDTIKS
jgi:hypothetical protein